MSVLEKLDVSRETLERLEIFQELAVKWTQKINLVSKSSRQDIWTRHIEDSAQIWFYAPKNAQSWVDLGSGGGFPGVVVSILAKQLAPKMRVTLVESDQRKSVFLRTALRQADVDVSVLTKRIEEVPSLNADVLSARALADLSSLMTFSDRHMSRSGVGLFPKGKTWKKEVDQARDLWSFEYECFKSLTDENSVILKVQNISHA